MKKAFNFLFVTTKAGFFLLAALLWSGVMYFVNNQYQITWKEIFVEADGMVFDLIVFGVVLTIYEAYREMKEKKERVLREKKEKIERLYEELDDYKDWDEMEARFRILGVFYRLKKLGESKIDLNDCFLEGANFSREDLKFMNFQKSNLRWSIFELTNLAGANFYDSILVGSNLHYANLNFANLSYARAQKATLDFAKLESAKLESANLTEANLFAANLKNANLELTDFTGAILSEAQLDGARVGKGWFEKLENWKVIGRETIVKNYFIDREGVLRVQTQAI